MVKQKKKRCIKKQPTCNLNYLNREAITVMSSKSHQDIHSIHSALHKHNVSLMKVYWSKDLLLNVAIVIYCARFAR